ncbi:MerR family transcriptional regulator [Actinophytocola xanthii]|uniref:MerR family transcriptional regulator n=1 Tax=Actinophytocola xanthii TaxID=1912961 RepID=A0A1Q8CYA2_9PSEU|nr:MerR family transcriptional regulator [Actinophytocola xanthii]OLF19341.1 MerR family transcriptional regulator [Actinophytocola xanthii]
MRPIDLAREHGMSAQAVRNYEEAGILPQAERGETGYRRYTSLHAQALRAFLALRGGHGHQQATEIMRATNSGDLEAAYRLIDAAHVALLAERDTRTEVATALASLSTATPAPVRGRPLTVGELAHRLDVHPATLRTWETEGILHPERDRVTGYRQYGPDPVWDAEIARQLRRGGYPLSKVARFVRSLREAGGADALSTFLASWQDRLTTRSRTLLAGAAQLDAYLTQLQG